MAYTAMPTLIDGAPWQAYTLNSYSENIRFLHSITYANNTPFTSQTLIADGESRRWVFVHRARYLHYKMRVTVNDTDSVAIYVNGNQEFLDGVNRSATYTWAGVFDFNTDITTVPAIGDTYEVYVDVAFLNTGNKKFFIDYFIETESSTL